MISLRGILASILVKFDEEFCADEELFGKLSPPVDTPTFQT